MEPPPAKRTLLVCEQNQPSAREPRSRPLDSFFIDSKFPWEEELHVGCVEWRRPQEICAEPKFILDGATRMDVCQGKLSNCWFLSAVACLSLYPQLLEKVVLPGQDFVGDYDGKFRFQFWQYGQWVLIEVDDRLPTVHIQRNEEPAHRREEYELLFMHSWEKDEFWSSLLEKAYAKLKGGYSALQLGFAGEALVDMTGGVAQTCYTNGPLDVLWVNLNHLLQRGALICCGNTGGELETANSLGILSQHMYSVTGTKQVQVLRGSVSLIRVRNPWGHTEWSGPWRDGGSEWLSVIDRKEIEVENLEDGEFWMEVEDFQKNFQVMEICHLSPESLSEIGGAARPWEYVTYEGCWSKDISSGGSIEYKDHFWMNPQYSLNLVTGDINPNITCSIIVSVMLKHKRLKAKDMRVMCYIFQEILQQSQPMLSVSSCDKHREAVLSSNLPPGRYVIIPSLERTSDEGEFLIRILTEKGSCARPMDSKAACGELAAQNASPTDEQCKSRFLLFADQDRRITDEGLHHLLTSMMKDFDPLLPGFTMESSRCLLASLDTSAEGSLCWEQFDKLWKNIITGSFIFSNLQRDKDRNLDKDQIGPALQSAGLITDDFLVRLVQLRYADKDGSLSYSAFICCLLKIKAVTGMFQAADSTHSGTVSLNYHQWLQLAVYS
ncbi:calpain-1 catalytic subunit isoform X2 [Xenopus laevis]|uniref:Calpain-1 catalytic subunit isoform X2 n=1 Tax=Xenopus laevis TaxID=8355 RepID=A0A8J0THU6_XENLA|nr:calpain-1 catalytic subunit isoform X2 [Xenopus laevis]